MTGLMCVWATTPQPHIAHKPAIAGIPTCMPYSETRRGVVADAGARKKVFRVQRDDSAMPYQSRLRQTRLGHEQAGRNRPARER